MKTRKLIITYSIEEESKNGFTYHHCVKSESFFITKKQYEILHKGDNV